jgi:hypothetical protein
MSLLWNDPEIKKTIELMDDKTRFEYQRMGQAVYNSIDYVDPKCPQFDFAAQVDLMLRDGLRVDMLTDEERDAVERVYGLNHLESYK